MNINITFKFRIIHFIDPYRNCENVFALNIGILFITHTHRRRKYVRLLSYVRQHNKQFKTLQNSKLLILTTAEHAIISKYWNILFRINKYLRINVKLQIKNVILCFGERAFHILHFHSNFQYNFPYISILQFNYITIYNQPYTKQSMQHLMTDIFAQNNFHNPNTKLVYADKLVLTPVMVVVVIHYIFVQVIYFCINKHFKYIVCGPMT